jgi:hypothetical protein
MLHTRIQVQKVLQMSDAKQKPKPQSQVEKFREAARELEADESEENFDRTLKRIAKAPPPKAESGSEKKP